MHRISGRHSVWRKATDIIGMIYESVRSGVVRIPRKGSVSSGSAAVSRISETLVTHTLEEHKIPNLVGDPPIRRISPGTTYKGVCLVTVSQLLLLGSSNSPTLCVGC